MRDFSSTMRTPKKITSVDGLLTLSSSHKKKVLPRGSSSKKCITIDLHLDFGLVRRDLCAKFVVNVFQYILYDTEVIPIPFSYYHRLRNTITPNATSFANLDLSSQVTSTTQFSAKQQHVLFEMFSKLNFLFDSFTRLLSESNIEIDNIGLCLGDSIRFAKQIYVINLANLNLYPRFDDSYHNDRLPFLNLRYLIDTFYKQLLNGDSGEQSLGTNCNPKNKLKNIILCVKVRSDQVEVLDKFLQSHQQEEKFTDFQLTLANSSATLGCSISKITRFNLNNLQAEEDLRSVSNFEIYLSNDMEEIIEEKLPEADEEMVVKSVADDRFVLVETDGDATHHSKLNSSQPHLFDWLWIQIGTPIRCVTKI